MKTLAILAIFSSLMFCGVSCAPTVATMSITETIGPNGEKTISTTKQLSQSVSHTQTSSTDKVLETFK
jgi:hypothetical protein